MTFTEKKYPSTGPVVLSINISEYPTTRALLNGDLKSDLIKFDFAGLKASHMGFKDMLRRNKYDVSEMAGATYLQAHEFGKPFTLLPIVVLGRLQHHCIGYNTDIHPMLRPEDLVGKTVGVRSYTQTTGLWARGILQNEYGVDPDSVNWLCFDQPHLEEYIDPPSVSFAQPGQDLVQMFLNGEVDAAILGMNMPKDSRVRPLIPNPHEEALEWYKREKFVPANHYIMIPNALIEQRPDVVRELWRLLVESRMQALQEGDIDFWPVGIEANRKGIEATIKYTTQQHMLTRPVEVDDLFPPLIHEIAS